MIDPDLLEQARALHASRPVVDLHADYPVDVYRRRRAGEEAPYSDDYVERLREGGVDVQVLAAGGDVPGQHECAGDWHASAVAMLGDVLDEEERGAFRVLRTQGDLEAALLGGQVGFLLHLEGARALGEGPEAADRLAAFHALGLRSLQLTWNGGNAFAAGVSVEPPHGLTVAGRRLVAECGRLGILLDVAHLSEPSFWDVLDFARGPVIASHANARALCPHRRNLTDEQVSALAATGGLVGVVFVSDFIDEEAATLDALVDHVDHLVALAGIDAVGVGTDYVEFALDLMTEPGREAGYLGPEGLRRVETLPVLSAALLGRGYAEEDVAKIVGGNALRVLRAVLPAGPPSTV